MIRAQRHEPRPANRYSAYRPCLRWDAGFTCCFCLLHESDLTRPGGIEGTGLTGIEHIEPQSRAPQLSNRYDNCAYACRYCNTARRDQPTVHPSGARLLHPWRDVWGEYFELRDDHLVPRAESPGVRDAEYTAHVYRLNDPRRVELRRQRRELIADRIALFQYDIAVLRAQAGLQAHAEDRVHLLALAQRLQQERRKARHELRWRQALPPDKPGSCRCDRAEHHICPDWLPVVEIDI